MVVEDADYEDEREGYVLKKRVSVALVLVVAIMLVASSTGLARTQITYWHQWTGQWTQVLSDIAQLFNESQDKYEVTAVVVPENFRERLMSGAAVGDLPDVVSLTGDGNLYMAERGLFLPIDELMGDEWAVFQEWAMPVVWEVNEWRGNVWALTPYIDIGSLYYNLDHFERAGLDPANPPRDIATLDAYTEKLTTYDSRGNIDNIGFYPSWGLGFWGTVFGGNLVDEAGAPIFHEDPKILAALEWIASYAEKYDVSRLVAFEAGLSEERAAALDPFLAGKKSMEQQGQWVNINIANYAPEGFRHDVTSHIPFPEGGRQYAALVRSAYGALAIPRGTEHVEGALEFIKFWVGYGYEEQRAKILEWGGWMPLDRAGDVWRTSTAVDYLEAMPKFRIFADILAAQGWTVMKTPVDSFLFNRLSSANDYARLLEKSPQEALNDAAAEVQREFRRIRR